YSILISEVMTSENLITAPVATTLEKAKNILQEHKIEKLPLVDDNNILRGLITIKDIEKVIEFPNTAKEVQGSLIVAAAAAATSDAIHRMENLVEASAAVIAIS